MKDDSDGLKSESTKIDWLQIHDLGNGNFNVGFWNFYRSTSNGQSRLEFKSVSKVRLFEILSQNGFFKLYRENGSFLLLHNEDNILTKVTPAQIKDFALYMLKLLPDELSVLDFKVITENLKEIFLKEHHTLFGENALSPLRTHKSKFLSDTKDAMFFPYKNGVVKVTKNEIRIIPYSQLTGICIWKGHIIDRYFVQCSEKSMYELFMQNVSNNEPQRIMAMRCAIGYGLHRYYNEVNTKSIILYDEEITDASSANGGTGKGLYVNALSKLRKTETIDGKKFDSSDKFNLQSVSEETEIVFFDDIRHDFDFERFNSILTNGWEVEAKHQQTLRIPLKDSPKMVIASNSILKCKDGYTAERRQYILEFSNFYSKLKKQSNTPVIYVHGCEFFYEWDDKEWLRFDNYMMESCKLYLSKGLPIVETKNVAYNRLLQETSKEFIEWAKEKEFKPNEMYLFKTYFESFKSDCMGNQSDVSVSKFGSWMKFYSKAYKLEYDAQRYNGLTYFKLKPLV